MSVHNPSRATSVRMAGIRQKGTKLEVSVAFALRQVGLYYRKNVKVLPGSPDFANRSRRWAIFVNGCFWHHHTGCRKATVPKSNTKFWLDKFRVNRRRDARAICLLREQGYRVVVIWECEGECLENKLGKILEARRINS